MFMIFKVKLTEIRLDRRELRKIYLFVHTADMGVLKSSHESKGAGLAVLVTCQWTHRR
jgi:hypothetical protein